MRFKSGKLGGLFVVRHPVGKIKIRETDILELVIMSSSSCKSLSMDRESTPYFFFISFNLICWHPPVRAASVAAVNNQGACVLLPLVPPPWRCPDEKCQRLVKVLKCWRSKSMLNSNNERSCNSRWEIYLGEDDICRANSSSFHIHFSIKRQLKNIDDAIMLIMILLIRLEHYIRYRHTCVSPTDSSGSVSIERERKCASIFSLHHGTSPRLDNVVAKKGPTHAFSNDDATYVSHYRRLPLTYFYFLFFYSVCVDLFFSAAAILVFYPIVKQDG